MTEDLYGWSHGELVTVARWHLMRGYGLGGRDEAWEMEYSPEGITCGGRQPVDEHLVAEGRRLLASVYPDIRVTLRRHNLTELRPDRR